MDFSHWYSKSIKEAHDRYAREEADKKFFKERKPLYDYIEKEYPRQYGCEPDIGALDEASVEELQNLVDMLEANQQVDDYDYDGSWDII